jgi:hypothetical protein
MHICHSLLRMEECKGLVMRPRTVSLREASASAWKSRRRWGRRAHGKSGAPGQKKKREEQARCTPRILLLRRTLLVKRRQRMCNRLLQLQEPAALDIYIVMLSAFI